MKLNINDLKQEMNELETFESLTALQGKITAQSPAQSGLNFMEASALLKEIAQKKRFVK